MAPALSLNDGVMVISLTYLSIDMQFQWQEFEYCQWPVHRWLLVSYLFILAFRLAHVLGSSQAAEGSGDFLLNLRHKGTFSRLLSSLTWLCFVPLFAAWTAVGTFWLWDSKKMSARCLPMGMPLCFIILWQVLSYAWICIHLVIGSVAWVLERRLRRTESSLRAMEDNDTVSRWGQVSELSGYTALTNNSLGGLAPDQIKALPEMQASSLDLQETECPICLNDFCDDDAVRQLTTCGHTFHRCCIDLWLLRRADCPLCKQSVLENGDAVSDTRVETEHWHV